MPLTYRFDLRTDLLVTTGTGIVTGDEMLAALHAITKDPRWHVRMRRFADYSKADGFDVSEKYLTTMLSDDILRALQAKHAYLMFSPTGASEFQKCIEKIFRNVFRVFYLRREAVDWLNEGVPAAQMITVDDTLPTEDRTRLRK